MIEEFTRNGQLPKGQEEASYEWLTKLFNLIKVTPTKMVLLHTQPGRFPLHKVWEPGKATVSSAEA